QEQLMNGPRQGQRLQSAGGDVFDQAQSHNPSERCWESVRLGTQDQWPLRGVNQEGDGPPMTRLAPRLMGCPNLSRYTPPRLEQGSGLYHGRSDVLRIVNKVSRSEGRSSRATVQRAAR